jgi:UV excision repair protein RAD23
MLGELGRQNPDLLALINAHQAEFLRLVNEPAGPEDAGAAAAALAAMEGAGGGEGGGGGLPPGAVQIQLTPDEAAALGRLEALGFDRGACLEAYLACDKDEALAANYLFENPPGEDEEMEGGGGGGA